MRSRLDLQLGRCSALNLRWATFHSNIKTNQKCAHYKVFVRYVCCIFFLAPFKVNGFAVCISSISNTRSLIKCIQNLSACYIYAWWQVCLCVFLLCCCHDCTFYLFLCSIGWFSKTRPNITKCCIPCTGNDKIDTQNWFIVHKLRSWMRKTQTSTHYELLILGIFLSQYIAYTQFSSRCSTLSTAHIQSKWNDCKCTAITWSLLIFPFVRTNEIQLRANTIKGRNMTFAQTTN